MIDPERLGATYRLRLSGHEPPVAAPTRLESTTWDGSTVRLNWLDNAHNETGYRIEHKTKKGWRKVAWAPPDATAAVATGLNLDSTYLFRVRAMGTSSTAPSKNNVVATTATSSSAGWYRVRDLAYKGKGEAGWKMEASGPKFRDDFKAKWIPTSGWQMAVWSAIEGTTKVEATFSANGTNQGDIITHQFPSGGDFVVDTKDAVRQRGLNSSRAASYFDETEPKKKIIALEDSYGNIDDDYDDFYWEVEVERLESVDVTVSGRHLVDNEHDEVSFFFTRDLAEFDEEITVGLDTLVNSLGDFVGTPPLAVTISAGLATAELTIPTSVQNIPHSLAWYFQPISQNIPLNFLGHQLLGVQVAPPQHDYNQFRLKLSEAIYNEGAVNLGGANDRAGQANEPLELKALRWTGAQMVDMGAVARNLGVDVMLGSPQVLGKLKIINKTVKQLIDAAERVAKHEDELPDILRQVVDRDYLFESSSKSIALAGNQYSTEVVWLIDRTDKRTVLGQVTGYVPTKVNVGGGLVLPADQNPSIAYQMTFEAVIDHDPHTGQIQGVELLNWTVREVPNGGGN